MYKWEDRLGLDDWNTGDASNAFSMLDMLPAQRRGRWGPHCPFATLPTNAQYLISKAGSFPHPRASWRPSSFRNESTSAHQPMQNGILGTMSWFALSPFTTEYNFKRQCRDEDYVMMKSSKDTNRIVTLFFIERYHNGVPLCRRRS